MRVATRQIVVEGVMPDDHPDDPTLGDSCTHVSPDNSAIHGRFDGPGDVDCFFIVPSLATIDPLIVRIFNRALGADPRFAVYDAGGRTLVAEVDEVDEIDLAVATASEGAFFGSLGPLGRHRGCRRRSRRSGSRRRRCR